MDCSPPGSPGHGMLQARILEWVVISFPRGSSWPRNQTLDSLVPCIAGGFLSTEPLGKPNILLYVYYSLLFHPLMCIILLSASFWIFSPPSPIGIKLFEVRDCLSYTAALNRGWCPAVSPPHSGDQTMAEVLSTVYTVLGVEGINGPWIFKVKDTAFRMNPLMSCFSHKM